MTIFSNFVQFLRSAFSIVEKDGFSGLTTGYAYWKSTSPFLGKIKTSLENQRHFAQKDIETFSSSLEFNLDENVDQKLRNQLKIRLAHFENYTNGPLVSIIIPTFDRVDLLKKLLESISKKTTYKNYEIIIVTNNSDHTSPMNTFLSNSNYLVKVFKDDYSFAAMNNFAASFAKGHFFVFLNDDTEIVTPDWLESLISIGFDDAVGAVGGKILYKDGKLQEAGSIIWKTGNVTNYGKNCNPEKPEYNFVRNVDFCSASMLMVKKDVFVSIGGFDTIYSPSYWEDADMCLKIKKSGNQIFYQPHCKIIHHENQTTPRLHKKIHSILLENKKKFVEKWSSYISNNAPEGINEFSDEDEKIHVLVISESIPKLNSDSKIPQLFEILVILQNMGLKISLWPADLQIQPEITELQQRGIRVLYGKQNFSDFLKKEGKKFPLVFLEKSKICEDLINEIKAKTDTSKIIYTNFDFEKKSPEQARKILYNAIISA